jgi:hypothetical protein
MLQRLGVYRQLRLIALLEVVLVKPSTCTEHEHE